MSNKVPILNIKDGDFDTFVYIKQNTSVVISILTDYMYIWWGGCLHFQTAVDMCHCVLSYSFFL